jgi:hypothetical protein
MRLPNLNVEQSASPYQGGTIQAKALSSTARPLDTLSGTS